MQKGGEGVQIACKIAYVLNGRPPTRWKAYQETLASDPPGLEILVSQYACVQSYVLYTLFLKLTFCT